MVDAAAEVEGKLRNCIAFFVVFVVFVIFVVFGVGLGEHPNFEPLLLCGVELFLSISLSTHCVEF